MLHNFTAKKSAVFLHRTDEHPLCASTPLREVPEAYLCMYTASTLPRNTHALQKLSNHCLPKIRLKSRALEIAFALRELR